MRVSSATRDFVVAAVATLRIPNARGPVDGRVLHAVAASLIEHGDTEPVACSR